MNIDKEDPQIKPLKTDKTVLSDSRDSEDYFRCSLWPPDSELEFSLFSIVLLIFGFFMFIADIGSDLWVAISHYHDSNIWYSSISFSFTIFPSLMMSACAMKFYTLDIKEGRWKNFIVTIFQLGPLIGFYSVLKAGMSMRKAKNREEKLEFYNAYSTAELYTSRSRMIEGFLESCPQLVVQLYIVATDYQRLSRSYYTIVAQGISIPLSLLSLSLTLMTREKVHQRGEKSIFTVGARCLFVTQYFFMISARVIAVALLASFSVNLLGLVCSTHGLISAMYMYWLIGISPMKDAPESRYRKTVSVYIGLIYIFTYFRTYARTPPSGTEACVYHVATVIESSAMIGLWYALSEGDSWFRTPALINHFVSYFLGFVLMGLYFTCFKKGSDRFFFQRLKTVNENLC
ncbi:XK-related protein 6-like [Limulus polyphemus]|uniref:XK-related protein n=1 Tax=Limulus polyphemus TaxID=6850 RepID=A0ABM1S4Y2_LIMPO|nr:XK-related protein 6-like [Limulus polyphemus]XP_013771997.1 XK-related protein 6-like [Limulus polyphemus]XP_022238687.1 XK-related protein 6-like [Limulus polyphemus]